ncbi:unnamed protein product [Polarella glacialis]|uniref:Amino acid transporter transmembrane domain-containing protein n=1 Tax=Polarella glacialis TaxID=89957 RepID=A0A813FJG8_POLGL|nr:unnamed protein product [Polarella glacialis]
MTQGSITMVSTMMQSVIIQMCILPMCKELEDRSPQKFGRVMLASFSILGALLILYSIAGYMAFGPCVQSNLLKNFPDGVFSKIAQLSMVFACFAVYPIMMIAMIAPIKNCSLEQRQKQVVASVTAGFVLASVLMALTVDQLGIVNVIDGALCLFVFVALAPGLVGLFLLDRSSTAWRASMATLITLGTILAFLGFIFLDNEPALLGDGGCFLPKSSGSISIHCPVHLASETGN